MVLWPNFGHCTTTYTINVWERIGKIHLAPSCIARGRGGVSTCYFQQIEDGICAKLWDMSHRFMSFVTFVNQGGAVAKFWPLHHYNECMGENGKNTLSTILHSSWKRGRVNLILSANPDWDMC